MVKKQIRITQESIGDIIRKTISEMRDFKGPNFKPDYDADEEDEDDEDEDEGYPYDKCPKNETTSPKQIKLSENQLREFVSYSVTKLLKEALGRPIYDRNGEFDGYEGGKYGANTMKLSFSPDEGKDMEWAIESVIDEGNYPGLTMDMFLDGGRYEDIWPIPIEVSYNISQGMKGDGYLQPDDPDEAEITGWEVLNPNSLNIPDELVGFIKDALNRYMEDEDALKERAFENEAHGIYEEANRGTLTHFGKKESEEAAKRYPNPYENMTWDEYCEAKRKEREEEPAAEPEDEKPNLGITTHFGGKEPERSPEEKEKDEHMFDDEHWVNKMNLSRDELTEIINKAVKRIMEEMNPAGEVEQVADKFPKKAAGTFTMNTRRGNTDKYKVYVEKTDNEELLTDIFIYDPMDKEWYPHAEYVVGIEEYTNGTWLPYWETFNGSVSIRALANCFGKVVKLWKKVGYLFDEDDEIPFRYSGGTKPVGKMF